MFQYHRIGKFVNIINLIKLDFLSVKKISERSRFENNFVELTLHDFFVYKAGAFTYVVVKFWSSSNVKVRRCQCFWSNSNQFLVFLIRSSKLA